MLENQKQNEKSRQQRRAIADAAISVIDQAGLEGTRLRDVARAANLTTGAITHYFESKDAVLSAALDQVVQSTLERIERGMAKNKPGDVEAFITGMSAYLPINEAGQREWRVWLAYWGRAIADPDMRNVHRDYYRAFVDKLSQSLLALRFAGEETHADKESESQARHYADAVIAAIDGIGTRSTLDPGAWNENRQRQTLDMILGPLLTGFVADGMASRPR